MSGHSTSGKKSQGWIGFVDVDTEVPEKHLVRCGGLEIVNHARLDRLCFVWIRLTVAGVGRAAHALRKM
jgi:hypothetical protein